MDQHHVQVFLIRSCWPASELFLTRSQDLPVFHDRAYDYIMVARVAGIDDYGRLHQNQLSRLPAWPRLETSFAMRDVLEGKND